MMQKETMSLANADKGLWSRKQGTEKSIIDYVMTNTEYLNNIKEMIITDHLQTRPTESGPQEEILRSQCNFSWKLISLQKPYKQKNAK